MEATYAEYEEWSEHGVPETVLHLYKKALQQMERCKPFEESLVTDLHWILYLTFLSCNNICCSHPFSFWLQNVCHFSNVEHLHVVNLQLAAEPPKLAEYQTYIEFETKEGDPARIQITFERTLAENCLVPDMWAKYTTYLVSIVQCLAWCCPF